MVASALVYWRVRLRGSMRRMRFEDRQESYGPDSMAVRNDLQFMVFMYRHTAEVPPRLHGQLSSRSRPLSASSRVWASRYETVLRCEGSMSIKDRGFGSMTPARQQAIASKGGKAAHAKGTAHHWTTAEAAAAGRKGGLVRAKRHLPSKGPLTPNQEG
jgi:hypothetical protein